MLSLMSSVMVHATFSCYFFFLLFCILIIILFFFFFFFSSRRRHTRYIGDWSSDVCSSDLENQNSRLPEDGARNRRALLLPARKGYAALADQSVEAFGELAHVVAESRNLRRPLDLGALGLFDSEGYVLGQRLAEEESLLRHVADGGAQLRERVFAHVNVVNEDCAG